MTFRIWKDRFLFWSVMLFALVASVADAASAAAAARLGASDALRVFIASAAWAVLVAFAATAALLLIAWLASLGGRDPGRRLVLGVAGASLAIAAALVACGLDLLAGRGISEKSWVSFARGAWAIAAPAGVVLFGWAALWALGPAHPALRARLRPFVCLVAAAAVLSALWADRTFYPRLYPVAHLALWLLIWVAVLVCAAALAPAGRPSTRILGGSTALLLGWSAIALLFVDVLGDPIARAAAFRETLFLKRALTWLKPAGPAEKLVADPEIARALSAARALDPALLDRVLPDRQRMNVLVVSIDAVRSDRLRRLRDGQPLTPNLDALFTRGTSFHNAWTTYPFTLMAFQSAFSGVYAAATDHFRYRELDLWKNPWPPQPTLASLLGAKGWRTEAVVGFPRWVKETLEREGGFQHFNADADPRAREREMPAEEVAAAAIAALDRDPARPFLLWVHFFDPHWPYSAPGSAPDAPHAARYDDEIHYADRELGRILAAMAARDLLGKTAILVFSDHGEDLVEHDHGTALTEEQIHVPMAVILPRVPPREVGTAVDLTDLLPTVLELVGLEKPATLHGQSLLPCALLGAESAAVFVPDVAFCELGGARLPQPRQFAAREGSLKIIYHADSRTYALFDLASDPNEIRDRAKDSPDALSRMKRVLDSIRGRFQ